MIQELLDKKGKGEELTEEEQKTLGEFDSIVNEYTLKLNEEITSLKKSLESNKGLEEEIQILKEKYNLSDEETKRVKKEKEELEKKIQEESVNIEDLRETLRKNAEEQKNKALQRQKEEQELMFNKQKEELEKRLKKLENELKEQSELNKISAFKQEIMKEKERRPYLHNELDKILNEVDINGLEKAKIVLNFLFESKDHDIEMDNYLKRKSAGTSIFKKEGEEEKNPEKKKNPLHEKYGDLNVELIKKYRFGR